MTRSTFARSKAPTRSYWRAVLVDIVCSKSDAELARLTVADLPRWVEKLAPGEAEQVVATERARRAVR
jgi:hypothetical protein